MKLAVTPLVLIPFVPFRVWRRGPSRAARAQPARLRPSRIKLLLLLLLLIIIIIIIIPNSNNNCGLLELRLQELAVASGSGISHEWTDYPYWDALTQTNIVSTNIIPTHIISLLTLSLLRLLDSNFLGNSLWTWEFHPSRWRFCLGQTLWSPES